MGYINPTFDPLRYLGYPEHLIPDYEGTGLEDPWDYLAPSVLHTLNETIAAFPWASRVLIAENTNAAWLSVFTMGHEFVDEGRHQGRWTAYLFVDDDRRCSCVVLFEDSIVAFTRSMKWIGDFTLRQL